MTLFLFLIAAATTHETRLKLSDRPRDIKLASEGVSPA